MGGIRNNQWTATYCWTARDQPVRTLRLDTTRTPKATEFRSLSAMFHRSNTLLFFFRRWQYDPYCHLRFHRIGARIARQTSGAYCWAATCVRVYGQACSTHALCRSWLCPCASCPETNDSKHCPCSSRRVNGSHHGLHLDVLGPFAYVSASVWQRQRGKLRYSSPIYSLVRTTRNGPRSDSQLWQ